MSDSLFSGLRSLLGLPARSGAPAGTSEFRNPIWGSDDDDDEDDELYQAPGGSEPHPDINISIYSDPTAFQKVMTKQMQDMMKMFTGMFGDGETFFPEEHYPGQASEGSIRDHYLKPGYRNPKPKKEDDDLDGKITSQNIAEMLQPKDSSVERRAGTAFEDNLRNHGSFFQTVITRSVTKPDGTVETRRIVKDHLGNVEETVTTTQNDNNHQDIATFFADDQFQHTDSIFKQFSSLWKIF